MLVPVNTMRLPAFLLALAIIPLASAHGTVEANELEVLLLADEETDVVYATGGYDIAQVFLGEAHDPAVASGAAGDGVYFRLVLAGGPGQAPGAGASTIVFTFDADGAETSRSLVIDGDTLGGDFDRILANVTEDGVEVQRAFSSYASLGVAPGAKLSGFRVESYQGDRLVDTAPGGYYAGPAELPGGTEVGEAEVTLAGTGRYMDVTAAPKGDGVFEVIATSLLQKGSQHLELLAGTAVVEGPASVSVPPKGRATFVVRASEGDAFEVTSDVGGRESFRVADGALLAEDDRVVARAARSGPVDVPGPALGLVLGVLALLALARRERA